MCSDSVTGPAAWQENLPSGSLARQLPLSGRRVSQRRPGARPPRARHAGMWRTQATSAGRGDAPRLAGQLALATEPRLAARLGGQPALSRVPRLWVGRALAFRPRSSVAAEQGAPPLGPGEPGTLPNMRATQAGKRSAAWLSKTLGASLSSAATASPPAKRPTLLAWHWAARSPSKVRSAEPGGGAACREAQRRRLDWPRRPCGSSGSQPRRAGPRGLRSNRRAWSAGFGFGASKERPLSPKPRKAQLGPEPRRICNP